MILFSVIKFLQILLTFRQFSVPVQIIIMAEQTFLKLATVLQNMD